MKKRKLQINLSNKTFYTILLLSAIILLGVEVYAYVNPTTGVGHDANEIGPGTFGSGGDYIFPSGSNVGIGTTDPGEQLEIAGNLLFTEGATREITIKKPPMQGERGYDLKVIGGDGNGGGWNTNGGDIILHGGAGWGTGSVGDVILAHTGDGGSEFGNVGIGTANPSEKLTVDGNVLASAFFYSSDERLKENIAQIGNPVEIVERLEGVSFNWKENGEKSMGLIAQDVEKILPELVATDNKGYKSIQYANLVAVLIEAVKEQQREINNLKEQLNNK